MFGINWQSIAQNLKISVHADGVSLGSYSIRLSNIPGNLKQVASVLPLFALSRVASMAAAHIIEGERGVPLPNLYPDIPRDMKICHSALFNQTFSDGNNGLYRLTLTYPGDLYFPRQYAVYGFDVPDLRIIIKNMLGTLMSRCKLADVNNFPALDRKNFQGLGPLAEILDGDFFGFCFGLIRVCTMAELSYAGKAPHNKTIEQCIQAVVHEAFSPYYQKIDRYTDVISSLQLVVELIIFFLISSFVIGQIQEWRAERRTRLAVQGEGLMEGAEVEASSRAEGAAADNDELISELHGVQYTMKVKRIQVASCNDQNTVLRACFARLFPGSRDVRPRAEATPLPLTEEAERAPVSSIARAPATHKN